jgi:hypothetical protein
MDLPVQDNHLTISEAGLGHLSSMSKWALFLAIMGFIGSGFMILFGIFFAAISGLLPQTEEMSNFPSGIIMVFYLILGVIYFFPSLFLLNFSSKAKSALASRTEEPLEKALKNLRSYFAFTGILLIVVIAVVIFAIAIGIIIGMFAAMTANV